ncbi:MAG: carboxypeptidase-like regulatory domain-containing protein [bacterium]|nr:carboxypeptidase-like regulatory domain-containing protein [bacterium]
MKGRRVTLLAALACILGGLGFLLLHLTTREPRKGESGGPATGDAASHNGLALKKAGRAGDESLFGRVTDAWGNPVPEASLAAGVFEGASPLALHQAAFSRQTTSDARGEFRFEDTTLLSRVKAHTADSAPHPRRKPFALLVGTKGGFAPTRIDLNSIERGKPLSVVLKGPCVVRGVVVCETGDTRSDAQVLCSTQAEDLFNAQRAGSVSGLSGQFEVSIAAEGDAELYCTLFDSPKCASVFLKPGAMLSGVQVPVELGQRTIVEGTVWNEVGGPVGDAYVALGDGLAAGDDAVADPVTTCPQGRYRIILPAESHHSHPSEVPEKLLAFHPDYQAKTIEFPPLSKGEVRKGVDVLLERGCIVEGTATDDGGSALAGVEVRVDLADSLMLAGRQMKVARKVEPLLTDDKGCFAIHFLPPGTYSLRASLEGYKGQIRELHLGPNEQVTDFDFVLETLRGFIKGHAVDEKGDPWTHGKVEIHRYGLYRSGEIKTDGSFELRNLPEGKYDITVDFGPNYADTDNLLSASCPPQIPTGTEDVVIVVSKRKPGAIHVRVRDKQGHPVKEFGLRCSTIDIEGGRNAIRTNLWQSGVGYPSTAWDTVYDQVSGLLFLREKVSSEDGEFVHDRLCPGQYYVSVHSSSLEEQSKVVMVKSGEEAEALFVLGSKYTLSGHVLGKDGHPLTGVYVLLRLDDGPGHQRLPIPFRRAWTSEDGSFTFRGVENGRYFVVAADKETNREVSQWVTVSDDDARVQLIFAEKNASVEGYVLDGGGIGVPGITVKLVGETRSASVKTDGLGYYACAGLEPGEYWLRAETSRWGGLWRRVVLEENERAAVNIAVGQCGQVQGKVVLEGLAERASAWAVGSHDIWLELSEISSERVSPSAAARIQVVRDFFSADSVPAGRYQVTAIARLFVGHDPYPGTDDGDLSIAKRVALFRSEPQTLEVHPLSTTELTLRVADPVGPVPPFPSASLPYSHWIRGSNVDPSYMRP